NARTAKVLAARNASTDTGGSGQAPGAPLAPRITPFDSSSPTGNADAVRGAKLVLLGVKPNQMREVTAELAPLLDDGTVLISIAAGVTTSLLESLVPGTVRVVRTMPN